MRHAMGERVCLAGSRASNNQQRRNCALSRCTVLHGPPLLRIEAVKVGGCRWHGMIILGVQNRLRDSRRAHNDFCKVAAHRPVPEAGKRAALTLAEPYEQIKNYRLRRSRQWGAARFPCPRSSCPKRGGPSV